MDDRATEVRNAALDLLLQTRMAVGQLRLYPSSTPQAQKAVAPAQAAIAGFPGAQGRVSLARTLRGLLVNGQRPPAGEKSAQAEKAWLQLLQEAQVHSIAILTAISAEELSTFLSALGRRFWELKEGKAINQRLREIGVQQAWVEEVEFVAMAKGDLLIEGAANKLEAAGARVYEIVQTLEQVIDGTAAEGLAEQVRLEIMRKLLEADPLLIQKAQAMNFAVAEESAGETGGGGNGSGGGGSGGEGAPGTGSGSGTGTGTGTGTGSGSGGGGGESGDASGGSGSGPRPKGRRTLFGSGKAPGWISFDQARKSLAEIARLLKTADGTDRETLRALGHLILGGFRYDPLLCELLKKFLSDESIDLIPSWMMEEQKPEPPKGPKGPAERAAEILALSEDSRIDALRDEAPALVTALLALPRPDLATELVKAAVEHARHVHAGHRGKAVKLLVQLHPLLAAEALQEARAALEARLVAALDQERDRAIFPDLLDLSIAAAEGFVLRGELERALPFLEAIRKQHLGDDKDYPEKRDLAFRGLERVATGHAFPILLEKVRAKQPGAARAVEMLGLGAAKGLVDRMKSSDSMAERISLAQLLHRTGPDARVLMAMEILQVFAPSEALKLVDLLRLAMPEDEAEVALAMALSHPALAVRRRAAAYLRGRPSPRTGAYFMDALKKEAEPSVRATFVEALGALAFEPAWPLLSQLLEARSEPDEVRAAAALALGALGKPQAIPLLARVSAKGRGFTLVLNPAPTAVRAAAARALAAYTRFPECREALRRCCQDDSEAAVRDAAQEALLSPLLKAFGDGARGAAVVSDPDELNGSAERPFGGYLSELPLDAVLQTIEEGGRTGLLLVQVAGSNAQVYFDRGAVVAADYAGHKDQAAFNQFCRWEGVCALFTPGVAAPAPGPRQSPIKMLMDACEVRDRLGAGGP